MAVGRQSFTSLTLLFLSAKWLSGDSRLRLSHCSSYRPNDCRSPVVYVSHNCSSYRPNGCRAPVVYVSNIALLIGLMAVGRQSFTSLTLLFLSAKWLSGDSRLRLSHCSSYRPNGCRATVVYVSHIALLIGLMAVGRQSFRTSLTLLFLSAKWLLGASRLRLSHCSSYRPNGCRATVVYVSHIALLIGLMAVGRQSFTSLTLLFLSA